MRGMKLDRCYCQHCKSEGPALGKGLVWNCTKCGSQTKPPESAITAYWIVLAIIAGAMVVWLVKWWLG